MRRPVGRLVGAVVPLSLTLALVAGGAAAAVGASTPAQDPATPATSTVKIGALGAAATVVDPTVDLPRPVRGATAIRLLGDQVDDAAAINDMRPRALKALLSNDPSAWLTQDGRLFYKDPLPSEPVAVRAAPAAAYPLGDTFALHSNPGADHTIFLDFDGAEGGRHPLEPVVPEHAGLPAAVGPERRRAVVQRRRAHPRPGDLGRGRGGLRRLRRGRHHRRPGRRGDRPLLRGRPHVRLARGHLAQHRRLGRDVRPQLRRHRLPRGHPGLPLRRQRRPDRLRLPPARLRVPAGPGSTRPSRSPRR